MAYPPSTTGIKGSSTRQITYPCGLISNMQMSTLAKYIRYETRLISAQGHLVVDAKNHRLLVEESPDRQMRIKQVIQR